MKLNVLIVLFSIGLVACGASAPTKSAAPNTHPGIVFLDKDGKEVSPDTNMYQTTDRRAAGEAELTKHIAAQHGCKKFTLRSVQEKAPIRSHPTESWTTEHCGATSVHTLMFVNNSLTGGLIVNVMEGE